MFACVFESHEERIERQALPLCFLRKSLRLFESHEERIERKSVFDVTGDHLILRIS